ncbi:hypothetical protein [Brucella abortus]|uniref:Uncharacterized protein n=1 Tax=Brucella abortus TaxID=235 RepID=A0AAE9LG80_BRUAO|nr:hypothetical protein [Brucella abortus]AEW18834.1 hypothetical protein BAA13334_II00447 [Brucella abortus A13334]EEP61689.1 Hypothetical protein, conserved [Brucella abortus str. 2308 A]AIJ51670.1 hypothetical protein DK48_2547 [Brucella abortus]AIJ91538.1 hypothetical protein DK55_2145 [Brucella abortus bv. 2 str. 86/8/59]MBI1652246.1 hypothetical protein [Brucella abortus]
MKQFDYEHILSKILIKKRYMLKYGTNRARTDAAKPPGMSGFFAGNSNY